MARNMRDFVWKALHDALRVGRFWENTPGYEQRATCGVCGVVESLEHILLECTAVGQREAWALVREWARKRGLLSYGSVLGAPVLSLEHVTGKRLRAVDRFYQTGVSRRRILFTSQLNASRRIWRF